MIICVDGIVNFLDRAVFAAGWDKTRNMTEIADLAERWLQHGAVLADIAPAGGDGVVDRLDLQVLADNWLTGF